MSYQINHDDMNKLVIDGEYIHYSIPVPPIPRGVTTYASVRHFWKMYEFVLFVTHVLPDHVNRPLEITDVPTTFDTAEIAETLSEVERKRRLIRTAKTKLVDMVFNLERRNEMLVNNLLEVEKMYNKLKEEKEDEHSSKFTW